MPTTTRSGGSISVLEFLARLLPPAYWPVAFIVAIVILRGALRRVLEALGARLKTFTIGGFEAEFTDRVTEAGAEASIAVRKLPTSSNIVEQTQNAVRELLNLAQISPRAAIAEAWRYVENALCDVTGASSNPINFRVLRERFSILLQEHAQEDPKRLLSMFDNLAQARNSAVHAREFALDANAVTEFIGLAIAMSNWIRSTKREPPTDKADSRPA